MNISKKNEVDLIVMGSHGASGFKEMFIGSNAEKVVRNSEIPVLIIKKEAGDFEVKKFVFASDFADEIKKPFAKVVEFANKFDAELHLVMINTPSSFKPTHIANEIMSSFIAGFNTPRHRAKASLSNDKLFKNFGFNIQARWWSEYEWQSSFADGTIPSTTVLDAQINYAVPKIKSVFKLSAANLGNNDYLQVIGAGAIGQQWFASWTINP